MAAVAIQNLAKSYAGHLVLDGITLDLHKGEKVGFVGANGSGKTTLFKLIVGQEPPDSGGIAVARSTSIGYLPQEPDLPSDCSLIEAVGEVFARHRAIEADLRSLSQQIAEVHGTSQEAALLQKYDRLHARFEVQGGYGHEVRTREVLGGLGFAPDEYQKPVNVLSGGQKGRAALARLLLQDCDLLLLDEPTNHLDIDATGWLEEYLAAHRGGVVIVSHDRYLLDRVVHKIIEIEDHQVAVYPTNYSDYAQAKRIRQLQAGREYEKQSAWLAHQRDYIARVHFSKDSAKQARGRRKYLDRMEAEGKVLQKPKGPTARMKLHFDTEKFGGEMVIRCRGATKGFDGLVLIRNLDFEMTRGEKVGIIGPNGVGKTTLLRMLMRQIPPDAGEVRLYENLTVGYYEQEHRDLDPGLTVIEAVRQIRPGVSEAEARSFLALFLFRGESVFKRIGDLSGGEQSRVLLARLVWTSPQVLVLDEPTNHLDIPGCEALEEALRMFPGSILMVSHDRYFLDRVVDRLLVLPAPGNHEIVTGNWSTYAEILLRRENAARIEEARTPAGRTKPQQTAASTPAKKKKSRSKYLSRRMEDLETAIIKIEDRVKELEAAFADPLLMKNTVLSTQLHSEYHDLRAQLADLNRRWEQAVDEQAGD
jgi:ATP-binding cassette subfamily F protein 3